MSQGYLFDHLDIVEEVLARSPLGLVSDVDGTLSPLVEVPGQATISLSCRAVLHRLVPHLAVAAAISGRPVEQVRAMLQVEGMVYLGNHGLQRWAQGEARDVEGAESFRQPLQEVLTTLRGLSMPGVSLEDKGVVLAVHYRQAQDPAQARAAILERLGPPARARELWVREGKMVVEVRPPIEMHKGTALAGLVQEYALAGVILLGDDLTDVDAFDTLHQLVTQRRVQGVAIAVHDRETPPRVVQEADLTLEGVRDVERLLGWLVTRRARPGLGGPPPGE